MKNLLKFILIGILAFYGYNTFKHPDGRASLQVHEVYDMLGNHMMDAADALLQRQGKSTDSATRISSRKDALLHP